MRTSSGMVFGRREVKRKTVKMPKEKEEFIKKCPSYGLTPDFYQALCLDPATGEEWLLEGFSGAFCKLSGASVNMIRDFGAVQKMLLAAIEQELNDLPEKAALLLGGDDAKDKKLVLDIRKEINARKRCVQTSIRYANPEMMDIFTEMGLPPFPGVLYYGGIYEFVSYQPEGYVLENLNRSQYDTNRYTTVSFEALKDGLMAYACELEDSKRDGWLRMVENVKPLQKEEEPSYEGQLLFAF